MTPLKLSNFDNQALLSLDLRDFLKEVRQLYHSAGKDHLLFQIYHDRVLCLHNEAILDLAARETSFADLRVKLRPYFSPWQLTYALIIKYLQAAGYRSEALSDFEPQKAGQRIFYTRYDVHVRDTPGLYGYLDINVALGVSSDSYIFWDYSSTERDFHQNFVHIGKFAAEALTEIGFHSSPADSGMIWSQFGGNAGAQTRWMNDEAGREFLEQLSRNSAACDRFIDTCYHVFSQQTRAFRAHFPGAVTLSGHGGAINNRLRSLGIGRAKETDVGPLHDLWRRLFSDQLLQAFMSRDPSWRFEGNHMPYKYGYLPISDSARDEAAYLDELDMNISKGKAIELLLHPATLHSQRGHGQLLELISARMGLPPGRSTLYGLSRDRYHEADRGYAAVAQIQWLLGTNCVSDLSWAVCDDPGLGGCPPGRGAIRVDKMAGRELTDNMILSDLIPLKNPTQSLLFTFYHDPIPQGGLLKIWLMPSDKDGHKAGEPTRSLFRQGERSSILLVSDRETAYLKVLLQMTDLSDWRIGTWATVEPLSFESLVPHAG